MRKDFYEIGDYVKYIGDNSTQNKITREDDFAKILEIKKYDFSTVVKIELLSSKAIFFCLRDKITPIETTEDYLKVIGFVENVNNAGKKAFVLNDTVISSAVITTLSNSSRSVFMSGFCIADFRKYENSYFEKYIKEDFTNDQKFYSDFKFVNNLNDLISYLKNEKGMEINIEKIIC